MPRNRMIKCEFWTSEQVLSCSPLSRLLFIGLWNFADDNGVHQASYLRLKAEIFPADEFTIENIKNLINELISNNLLIEYEAENKKYWMVTGWKQHQKIDKPTYRHPLPSLKSDDISETSLPYIDEHSTSVHRNIDNNSTTSSRIVATKEKKKKVKEKNNIGEVKTSPVDAISTDIQEIFQYWQEIMNHPKAKLDKKRKKIIKDALELGYSIGELKQAIDGCSKTPHNMGKNDRHQIYDDIGLILRDSDHIERFINNSNINPHTNGDQSLPDFMKGVL
ncbi:hypothetical protein E3983_10260 [Legionella israelensis]|uniref:Uncharacterized protein n=1 Tax=Legionella israelensis TaxID=454 RepID=A0AAX1EI52_9GAMM|nr:hypothetical protein [Legionella israelensis]QBR84713.1 hypothetical protein E3983_10260 [Legionella israelensis]